VPARPRSSCRRRAVLGAALALAVAGCGGAQPKSDEQLVTDTLRQFLHAQAGGETQAACALLSPAGERALNRLVAREAEGIGAISPTCEQSIGLVRATAGARVLKALDGARVSAVRVHGSRASATIVDGTAFARQRVTLSKTADGWRIDAVPGLEP